MSRARIWLSVLVLVGLGLGACAPEDSGDGEPGPGIATTTAAPPATEDRATLEEIGQSLQSDCSVTSWGGTQYCVRKFWNVPGSDEAVECVGLLAECVEDRGYGTVDTDTLEDALSDYPVCQGWDDTNCVEQ